MIRLASMTTPSRNRNNGSATRNSSPRSDVAELIDAGFRYAFSLAHHRQDAEDLVQQACLRVFRRKGNTGDKSYLFVTIRNLFLDKCRRRSLVSFTQLSDETTPKASPLEIRHTDNKLDLEMILGSLPSEEREILYLNCIEGFTADEIGVIMGTPRGTILSQLARTKRKLTIRFRSDVSEEKATP